MGRDIKPRQGTGWYFKKGILVFALMAAWFSVVYLCTSATEETGAMGHEIESRQGIGW
jgi:hypothetical protein